MMSYKHKFFMYVMLMSFLECGIYSYIFIQSVALPAAISIAFILTVFRYIMAFIFESKSKFAEYVLLSSDTFAITTILIAVLFIPIYIYILCQHYCYSHVYTNDGWLKV